MSKRSRVASARPSAPLVISVIALIASLTGTAFAAGVLPANSVGHQQIAPGSITASKLRPWSITTPKIKAGAVTSSKVQNGSLRAVDFRKGELPAGAKGEAGTARAYAKVTPGATPTLVPGTSVGFTAVTRTGLGGYCLTPAAGTSPATHPAVASVPPNGATEAPMHVAVDLSAAPAGCAAGDYKVVTSRIFVEAMGGVTPVDDVPFAIIVA